MIYLFNSAYRTLYTRNVLNTLFLPAGSTNEYRYRVRGGETIHIAPAKYDELKGSSTNEEISIIFIDRFGIQGYVYHPLRLGELVLCREEDDRLYFRVRLYDYIYPRTVETFNTVIKRDLSAFGLPKLSNNDPYHVNDGFYAIKTGSIFSHDVDFVHGNDAWISIVEQLRTTRAFISVTTQEESPQVDELSTRREFLFIKCNVINHATNDRILEPKLRNNESIFSIVRAKQYKLRFTYRYPTQMEDNRSNAVVDVKFGENLRPLAGTKINVDSYNNNLDLSFATKRYLEEHEDGINFIFTPSNKDNILIGPDTRLLFHIGESSIFWVQIFIALLLFSILSVIIGIDFSEINLVSPLPVIQTLWPNALASFLQAFVLFWIFRLVGKKFF